MTKDCLRYAPMIGARPGELTEVEARALSTHVEGCPTCRALAAEAALTEGLVAEALLAQANARDFAPFVDAVMARVGEPRRRSASLLGQLRQRWKAFALAAAALVVVAAGSAFMYVRSTTVEEPERVAAVSMELQGGSTVLQTSDGPVVLLEPDDDTGS